MTLAETLKALPEISQIKAWNDRHYITLEAAYRSRAKADLTSKIWVKGDTLTIETGKGYHSDAYIAAKHAVIAAAEAAGATVRSL